MEYRTGYFAGWMLEVRDALQAIVHMDMVDAMSGKMGRAARASGNLGAAGNTIQTGIVFRTRKTCGKSNEYKEKQKEQIKKTMSWPSKDEKGQLLSQSGKTETGISDGTSGNR